MPRRRKLIDENPAQPVVGELSLGLPDPKAERQKEVKIRRDIWEAFADNPWVRLFPNNVGVARRGKCVIRYGLKVGSSDLIGWVSVIVTEAMLGKRIAIFASPELKTKTGRLSPEQEEWLALVKQAGGIAGVARSAEEAKELLGR